MRATKDCAYPDCEACQHPDCVMSETDITALLKRRRRQEDPEAYRQRAGSGHVHRSGENNTMEVRN